MVDGGWWVGGGLCVRGGTLGEQLIAHLDDAHINSISVAILEVGARGDVEIGAEAGVL